LGEADLHLAAAQRRPVLLEVDRELLEAEQVAVEATAFVEVADVVPDRRRHQLYRASPGSSRLSLSVWGKAATGARATVRGSDVAVRVRMGRTAKPPSTGTTRSSVAPTATIAA